MGNSRIRLSHGLFTSGLLLYISCDVFSIILVFVLWLYIYNSYCQHVEYEVDGIPIFRHHPTIPSAQFDPAVLRTVDWPGTVTPFGGSLLFKSTADFSTRSPGWRRVHASIFRVRARDYGNSGQKIPSAAAMFEPVSVDLVRGIRKLESVGKLFTPCISEYKKFSKSGPEDLPELIILHGQFPLQPPSLWNTAANDQDPGCSLVVAFAPNRVTDPAVALQLLRRAMQAPKAEDARFKLVGRVENLSELSGGIAEIIENFNNKPVLLTKSCTIIQHPGRIMEIIFDVRMWNFVARKSLSTVQDQLLKDAVLSLALLVEGRDNDELPEQVLGCVQLEFVDIAKAKVVASSSNT